MSRLFFIASLSLFIVVLPTKSYAVDEYQEYKVACSNIVETRDRTAAYKNCKCDFAVKDKSILIISTIDRDEGTVTTYTKTDDGKIGKAFVRTNCKFENPKSDNFECLFELSPAYRGSQFYTTTSKFLVKDETVVDFWERVDKKSGETFIASMPSLNGGGFTPFMSCYKKKGLFNFKMPWK